MDRRERGGTGADLVGQGREAELDAFPAPSSSSVAGSPGNLAPRFGPPGEIGLDSGPKGTGKAMFERSGRTGVGLRVIEPGKPAQNAFGESFTGELRDECVLHWLRSLSHARNETGRRRNYYYSERPHSALGYLSPTEFPTATTVPALETPAVSAPSLDTADRPEIMGSIRP